jgi:radical SAM superfamily enzyme YgiQ (UPF0313 family)
MCSLGNAILNTERSADFNMTIEKSRRCSFEIGPIRPPSEGKDFSLLIRATRNCPWNRCMFCSIYKDKKFEYRSVEDIKQDIDVVSSMTEEMKAASWKMGQGGRITDEVILSIIQNNSEVYGGDSLEPDERVARVNCLVNVANWLSSGAKTVFLQDANTLIMRPPELIEVLRYLKETFPTIERITSYARAKTAAQRTPEELKALHEAGLSRLHIGLESGSDEVLAEMQKGVTAEEHIKGGRKIVESGISLSEYVMPGLGGRRWSESHAKETARVLNQIDPAFIRIRSLMLWRGMPLQRKIDSGEFEVLTEDEVVDEIRLFIENLSCNSYVASDQMSNLLLEVEGQLPQHKQRMLDFIDRYRSLPLEKRLKFRLHRRLQSYMAVHGDMPQGINDKVQEALGSIKDGSPDAEAKVDQTIEALKGGFM